MCMFMVMLVGQTMRRLESYNLSPAVAGFDVARRVPLKSRVNWNAVCEALSGLNWRSIFRSPTMVHDFDKEVSGIMERFVPWLL